MRVNKLKDFLSSLLLNKDLIFFHLGIIACLFLLYIFSYLTGIGCIFKFLLGLPCPTCGMTRAILSLLCFDFESYMYYQPFALPFAIALLILIHSHKLYKNKIMLIAICASILIIVADIIYYFIVILPNYLPPNSGLFWTIFYD